jgi:anthranilate phosphoribosyltransferase
MKHVALVRKELGIRTVFNVLGPLTNPANAYGQLLGVFSKDLVPVIAEALKKLGVKKAMVVHGNDGLDEITLTGNTTVCEVDGETIKKYEISPEEYGLNVCSVEGLKGGAAKDNAEIILKIFKGEEKGPKRDIILLNSGAALYIGNKVKDLKEGIEVADEIISSGKALNKLNELIEFSNKL